LTSWRPYLKKEPFEDKFPEPFIINDVQHNYKLDSQIDIREGALAINACFLRFLEYRKSGILRQRPDGYLGTLLKLPLRDIDDLRSGEGAERSSLYLFLKSVPASPQYRSIPNSPFQKHLVYVRIPGRHGMRFHFKTEADQTTALNEIRSSQDTYEKWLSSTDPTILGKQCPHCSSTLLIPTITENRCVVECGHCGKRYLPAQLKETK
jgi:hypothetical protein